MSLFKWEFKLHKHFLVNNPCSGSFVERVIKCLLKSKEFRGEDDREERIMPYTNGLKELIE